MRVVFMGSPRFAATVLQALLDSAHEVVGVLTRPDAVRGRGRALMPTPVKELACARGIPVLECSSLKAEEAFCRLALFEADAFCVAAYGAILPKRVLDLPEQGCLNVHASLLPRWRGAAPIERAVLAGDKVTGVGIMRMEEGLDTGPVALTRSIEIGTLTAEELGRELSRLGGEALVAVLDALDAEESLEWREQPQAGVTYADKLAKGELDLRPALTVNEAFLRVQAAGEGHTSRCVVAGKPLTVLRVERPSASSPEVGVGKVAFAGKRLYLGCQDGPLEVLQVKPDGKKPMDAKAFSAGIHGIKQNIIEWQGNG